MKIPRVVHSSCVLSQNVIVTGGNTLFPGVEERLRTEMRAIRPFQSDFSVLSAGKWLLQKHPVTGFLSKSCGTTFL